ncbi:MAG: queuosine precursor transporter [Lachnospiraceae bacterium]|nr:queuosine precursor transporter [Lachnospiraceae bacterium]
MNLMLGILEIIVCFFGIVILDKLFGKWGLFAWISLAVVFANIQVAKQVDILGFATSLGNVVFASTYLTTDILNEKYGEKSSRNAVKISAAALVAYIIFAQITQSYIPNKTDVVDSGMKQIFSMAFRITIASGAMFLLSNWCDVIIYQKIKKITGGKYMWFRNNVSTIICNCGENFAFTLLAFLGTFSFSYCMQIALSASLLEIIIALCDTPFLYIAKHLTGRSGILLEKEDDMDAPILTDGNGTASGISETGKNNKNLYEDKKGEVIG